MRLLLYQYNIGTSRRLVTNVTFRNMKDLGVFEALKTVRAEQSAHAPDELARDGIQVELKVCRGIAGCERPGPAAQVCFAIVADDCDQLFRQQKQLVGSSPWLVIGIVMHHSIIVILTTCCGVSKWRRAQRRIIL